MASLLAHLEHTADAGCWVWSPHTGEVRLSPGAFRLLGLRPRPSPISLARVRERIHPADRGRFDAALDAWVGGSDRHPVALRVVREDEVVRELRANLASLHPATDPERVTGSVRDVSAARLTTRALDVRTAVSDALDRWTTGGHGAACLLAAFGEASGLPFGVFWAREDSGLAPRWIWHENGASLVGLAETTREWRPDRSTPLGTTWACSQPHSWNDAAAGTPPARAAAIRAAGLRAVVAVPVVAGDEPLAVLEFLSRDPIEPTDPLLATLPGIGREVGNFLYHRRGELTHAVLTPREAEVLQLAARGISAHEIAHEMHLSPATVKRHFEDAYARLGARDRVAAVAIAMRHGWIT